MRKFLLLWLCLVSLVVPDIGHAESYLIEFAGSTATNDPSTVLTNATMTNNLTGNSNKDCISSFSGIDRVYEAKLELGLKFGTGSYTGSFIANLSEKGQVNATSIVVKAAKYNTDTGNLVLTATLKDGSTKSFTINSSELVKETLKEYTWSNVGEIKSIKVATSAKRAFLKSITVNYGGGSGPVDPDPEAPAAPTFTVDDTVYPGGSTLNNVAAGTEFEVNSEDGTMLNISVSPAGAALFEAEENYAIGSIGSSCVITATATRDGLTSAAATLTVNVASSVVTPTGPFTLLTRDYTLQEGDEIIITNSSATQALSTTQNTNNRAQTSVTVNADGTIDPNDKVQILTLKAASTAGQWNLYTGSGYLYAASSSANYLKTENNPDANGNANASISILSTGKAEVKFNGNYTRNSIRYNNLFSCYSSGQQDILIYYRSATPATQCGKPKATIDGVAGTSKTADNKVEIVISGKDGQTITVTDAEGTALAEIEGVTIDGASTAAVKKFTVDGIDNATNTLTLKYHASADGLDDSDEGMLTVSFRAAKPAGAGASTEQLPVGTNEAYRAVTSATTDATLYYMAAADYTTGAESDLTAWTAVGEQGLPIKVGTNAFKVVAVKAGYAPSEVADVTYTATRVVEKPVFSMGGETITDASITATSADVITVTAQEGATIHVTANPAASADITVSEAGNVATILCSGTVVLTATASYMDGEVETNSSSATINVKVKRADIVPGTGPFILLTDASILEEGDEIIITNSAANRALSTTQNTNNRQETEDFTLATVDGVKQITPGDAVQILTLEASATDKQWYLYADEGYLAAASSGSNYLHTDADASADASASISVTTAGVATVKFNGSFTRNNLMYNSSSKIFSCYSTKQGEISVYYRKAVSATFVMPLTVTDNADEAGFETDGTTGEKLYHNALTLTATTATTGAEIKYTVDGGETLTATDGKITVDAPATIVMWGELEGRDPSAKVEISYDFRPAQPEVAQIPSGDGYSVEATTATEGATLLYSADNGATWSEVAPVFTAEGVHNVVVKAVKDEYTNHPESATRSFNVHIYGAIDMLPFTLLTDLANLAVDDQVILVAATADKAAAPFEAGGNNLGAADVTRSADGQTIELHPEQTAVEIFTMSRNRDNDLWSFTPINTEVDGQLYAASSTSNWMRVGTDKGADAEAHIITGSDGISLIEFQGANVNNKLMYFTGGNKGFSAYADDTPNNLQHVMIYHRGLSNARVARPTASIAEGVHTAAELAEGVTLTSATDGATIYYTTDGSDPRTNGSVYSGDPINVGTGATIRAFAVKEGMLDSYNLIASYKVFAPKAFTRVTRQELRNLRPDDEIIIVASPSGVDELYAISRTQINKSDSEIYREAVKLGVMPDARGTFTLSDPNVQVFTLLAGEDRYSDYDWRLYAAGTRADGNLIDGYLYSAGDDHTLSTQRLANPYDERMANADVQFLDLATDKVGNEYGGVTVHFYSPDGHEETYPNYLALHNYGEGYRFDTHIVSDFSAENELYHVSLFKAYDPNAVSAPTFSVPDGMRISSETPITLSTVTQGARIWYSIDDPKFTTPQLYNGSIMLETSAIIYAYAEKGKLRSDVSSQHFEVSADRIFELVTSADKLRENDRIIIVNAIPYTAKADKYGNDGPYYAVTSEILNNYRVARAVEEVNAGDHTRLIVPAETNIMVFNLEIDGSAADSERPWLINCDGQYVEASGKKDLRLRDLPENLAERGTFNAAVSVVDREDRNDYAVVKSTGEMTDLGKIIFSKTDTESGTTLTTFRFNPSGAALHFNVYENIDGIGSENTYPVRIYRAADVVLPPSITIYPNEEQNPENNENAYANDQEIFNNPIRIEIERNPSTTPRAQMKYDWNLNETSTTVAAEFDICGPNSPFIVYLDGPKAEVDAAMLDRDETAAGKLKRKYEIDAYDNYSTTLRAIAVIGDNDNISRSLPRNIRFRTVAPVVRPVNTTEESSNKVMITLPDYHTYGCTLHYTIDGTEPTDESPAIEAGAEIDLDDNATLTVGAFKDGYEPAFTVYDDQTFFPEMRAFQLLELTDKANLTDEQKKFKYMTVASPVTGYHYLINVNDNDDPVQIENIDTGKAQAILLDPEQYLWTADYYIHTLDSDEFVDALPGATITDVTADDGFGSTAHGVQTEYVTDDDNANATAYGTVLRRKGNIGRFTATVTLNYTTASGAEKSTTASGQVTPSIPRTFGADFDYATSQSESTLKAEYPDKEFIKISIPSSVDTDGNPATDDMVEAIVDIDEVAPRYLDAVFSFHRPNVSAEILDRYLLHYNVFFTNNLGETLSGSGLYTDEVADPKAGDVVYAFTLEKVSPYSSVFPTLKLADTEYIQKMSDDDAYDRIPANYGAEATVEAEQTPNLSTPTVSHFKLSVLLPGVADGERYNDTDGCMWRYDGHEDLKHDGDQIHDDLNISTYFFHIETLSADGEQYIPYEHLVKHEEGHNEGVEDSDKFIGTYFAVGLSEGEPQLRFSPVYLFLREPDASELTTKLTFEQPYASMAAVAQAAKAPAKASSDYPAHSDTETSAPVKGSYLHQGTVDMSADNIADLTDDPRFVVMKGLPIESQNDNVITGIEDVRYNAPVSADAEYFNLQGVRLERPAPGQIVIERRGTTARKILVK